MLQIGFIQVSQAVNYPVSGCQGLHRLCRGDCHALHSGPYCTFHASRGIFENERNHGLKYCPCRLCTKVWEEDLKIVCPCHFTIHETYKGLADGECWCGLFVRRK